MLAPRRYTRPPARYPPLGPPSMIPLRDLNPSRTAPVVTVAILAANALAYIDGFIAGPILLLLLGGGGRRRGAAVPS
jgi:hypothetical protein